MAVRTDKRSPRRRLLTGGGVLWLAAAIVGLGRMSRYETTAGVAANVGRVAPAAADEALVVPGHASLVAFVHPFCPCSRASMDALDGLLSRHPGAAATIVFADVRDGDRSTLDGELWRRAEGRRRVIDSGGAIARRFDAHASGQVFVYDAAGALGYAGGLTASRGQAGDGVGLRSADAALDGRTPTTRAASVFGCELE